MVLKDHKLRQEMFHRLEKIEDINQKYDLYENISNEKLIIQITEYFTRCQFILQYPAKSYAVAIIYSKLLEDYFNIPFLESLNDPELLYNNDHFFVPYIEAHQIYDEVLNKISLNFNINLPQITKTIEYFKKEFYLNENKYFINK